MTTKERLWLLLEELNLRQNQFADKIGKSPQYVNNYLKGDRNLGRIFVEHLKNAFPDLNVDWLLYGEGDMFEKKSGAAGKSKTKSLPVYENIPCGSPSIIFSDDPVKYMEVEGVKNLRNPIILKVKGDSNIPLIREGDYIIAYQIDKPKNGDLIATNFKSIPGTLNANIKLFQPLDKSKFLLKPINTEYETTLHSYKDVYSFYKCKKLLRDLY